MKKRTESGDKATPKLYGSTIVANDLKVNPSAPPAPWDDVNATATANGVASLPPNIRAPAFQRLRRGNHEENAAAGRQHPQRSTSSDQDDEKVCRICLEEDSPETMIAPCRCKGSSRWVHRECLDEWRTHEKDRAFSKCTECLFEYYLQPVYKDDDENETDERRCCGGCNRQRRRRCLFYWMVSRDVCFGIVLQQLIVLLLGAIVWACDADRRLPAVVFPSRTLLSPTAMLDLYCYYGFGWFAFLVATGIYGSIVMCRNGCDPKRAIPRVGPPSEAEGDATAAGPDFHEPPNYDTENNHYYSDSNYNYSQCDNEDDYDYSQHHHHHQQQQRYAASPSIQYYRRARRRHRYYRRPYYDNYCYGPNFYPMYVYPTGNNRFCCCCCCDSDGPSVDANNIAGFVNPTRANGGSGSSSSGSSSRNSSESGEGKEVLFVLLLIVAAVLAIIGFFVGVVIIVVAVQRIVGRHVYLLQKRQLVQEFQVLDLQGYDMDAPIATAPMEDEAIGTLGFDVSNANGGGDTAPPGYNTKHPPPSAPIMTEDDAAYLHQLGLVDR